MAISDWYPLHNVEVGKARYADGKWRVEYDELVTRMRVCSNNRAFTDLVYSGLDHDSYRRIAEQIVVDLNTRH